MSGLAHRRRLVGVASLIVAGVVLCAACGSVYSQADSPDGGDGMDDANANDASLFDVSTNDASDGASLDASTLARCEVLRGDSAVEDFFCTDFEGAVLSAGNVPTGFTDFINPNDAGTVALVDDAGVDASRALDVTSMSGGTVSAHTFVRVKLTQATEANQYQQYAVDFDFRLVDAKLDYEGLGMLVFNVSSDGKHGIAGYGPGPPQLLSRQANGAPPTNTFPNDQAWHHASVTLDRSATTATYKRTITIDGKDADGDNASHTIIAGSTTELWLGVFDASFNAGGAHARFDNVVLRRRLQ